MSAPQSRIRKSTRQPVPNPIYQQGITQLKNVQMQVSQQNTSRIKRKTNKNNDEEMLSYDQQRNSQYNYQQSLNVSQRDRDRDRDREGGRDNGRDRDRDQYLACKMPNGASIRVRFLVEGRKDAERDRERDREREREREREKRREKERERQAVHATVKPSTPIPQPKKPQTTNLLNLFIQAIDNAEGPQQPSSQLNPASKQPTPIIQKQKQIPTKPKRPRHEQQDFIKKVIIQNNRMVIFHSQLRELEYQLDWHERQQEREQGQEGDWEGVVKEEDGEEERERREDWAKQDEDIRRKLENWKGLKNVAILNS